MFIPSWMFDFLIELEQKEIKMTREEAVDRLKEIMYPGKHDMAGKEFVSNLIKGLEALGLIKFDEPKLPVSFAITPIGGCCAVDIRIASIEAMLKSLGYKIVKVDNA